MHSSRAGRQRFKAVFKKSRFYAPYPRGKDGFVRVTVPAGFAPRPSANDALVYELCYPNGVRLRPPAGIAASDLGYVYDLAAYAGRNDIVRELNEYYRSLGADDADLFDAGGHPQQTDSAEVDTLFD